MADPQQLELPNQVNVADPGAHQLAEASGSEDQFTDAQSVPESPKISSPVPKTRVEKVDGEPSHGEVPGTDAYKLRKQDAKPDEIAVIPDQPFESSSSTLHNTLPIPTTVVEESIGDHPGQHSAEHQDKRKADAAPDILLSPDGEVKGDNGVITPDVPLPPALSSGRSKRSSRFSQPVAQVIQGERVGDGGVIDAEGDDFGEDFDDFEEGAQDDDFDDFDDSFQHAQPAMAATAAPPSIQQETMLPFPVFDFDGLSPDEVMPTIESCLASVFPPEELDLPILPPYSKDSTIFLNSRSASLWSQLIAPPPLAPPDWIRSRTRRLFLVSLGVPVDLDEILPASKQKKLVLPSLNFPTASPRASSDLRSVSRLKQGEGNISSTSVDSQGKPSISRKRKGPPPQPELDMVTARHLCKTTDKALGGMIDHELQEHLSKLEAMEGAAKEVLDYWTKRADEKIGDREAFEGVIENLVAHARKVRK